MISRALAQLESLREPLTADLPIADLETFEVDWKQALGRALSAPLSGADARRLATLHQDIGLLPKYKSYAIKASSPLGYSIFLQEPGKGFSFQQHRHHKVEIFHVLEALPALRPALDDLDAVEIARGRVLHRPDHERRRLALGRRQIAAHRHALRVAGHRRRARGVGLGEIVAAEKPDGHAGAARAPGALWSRRGYRLLG